MRGFTLVEMAVVILIFGLLIGFGIPAFQRFNSSNNLRGATENVAAQLRMAREKAMATGMDQPMHYTPNFQDSDYHIHYGSGFVPAKWKLPRGITFYAIGVNPTMNTTGRSSASGLIILQDTNGNRDTVSVLTSGMVLTK